MKLVVDKDLKDLNCDVTIKIAEVEEDELELFKDFGNPTINVGGAITKEVTKTIPSEIEGEEGTVETTIETVHVIGDSFVKLTPDFILTRQFAKKQHGTKAIEIAEAYVDVMVERITKEITALKAKSDTFSGVEEIIL